MKEHPIIFSAPMVRAILDGKKTQTRRILTPHFSATMPEGMKYAVENNPYGQPGDLFWVRETFRIPSYGEYDQRVDVEYKADHDCQSEIKWKPSIHMPKKFARIWLKITDIRVERLQDISEVDAITEGIQETNDLFIIRRWMAVDKRDGATAIDAFKALWNSINANRASWDSNPWVWVVSFERTEKP